MDYDATTKAFDLRPVFDSLRDWAAKHNLSPEPAPPKATAIPAG